MNRHLKDISRRRHGTGGFLALVAILLCTLCASLQAVASEYSIVSRTLLTDQESCPNGVIDPGETNTVRFVLKKLNSGTHDEVQVQILDGGNVDFPIGGPSPKVSVSKDGTVTADLRFRAGGSCGASLTPTVGVSWKTGDTTRAGEPLTADAFQLGLTVNTPRTFSNTAAVTINDFDTATDKRGRGAPYPSVITVSGVPNEGGVIGERVSKVTVTLNNVSHPFSSDLNIVLVSPAGKKIALMKQAGNGQLAGATLTFDNSASPVPAASQITSGTYKPADYNSAEEVPDQAGPYSTDLTILNVSKDNAEASPVVNNPNGDWKLYVQDDTAGGAGQIAGGWSLTLTTSKISCCNAGATFPEISKDVTDAIFGPVAKPGIPTQEINEDAVDSLIAFSVSDVETTDPTKISVTVTSSDQSIVKDANISVSNISTTENKQIKISKPEANANGSLTLTVTATDQSGNATSTSFTLNVKALNDAPVISDILGQSSNKGVATPEIPFTVSDVETAADSLNVFATSDNAIVPDANITIRGTGSSRTIQVTPASSAAGSANITISANDGTATTTKVFKVAFITEAGDPTITPLVNASVEEDKTITLPIVVRSNSSTPVANLVIDKTSSNPTLVPVANIVITGTGSDRTVAITPAADEPKSAPSATSDITLTVRDPGNSKSSPSTFTLTVNAKNDAPIVSAIADQTIDEDGATGDIAFTATDVEGSTLTITAVSSNVGIVPSTSVSDNTTPGIKLGGSGSDRTIRIKPSANAFGRTTITVSVSDGTDTTTRSFNVTVNSINDAPELGSAQQTTTTVSGSDSVVALPSDSTAVADLGSILEDTGLSGTTQAEQQIKITGISPGPGESLDQSATVSLSVSVDKTDLITNLSIDPTSLSNSGTQATIKYKLGINKFGLATFTVTATDNLGASTVRKFKVNVTGVNDAPTLATIPNRTIPKTQGVTIPITATDVETPSSQLFYDAVADAPGSNDIATMVFNANGSLSIVPKNPLPNNPSGSEPITIHVTITDRGADNSNTSTAGGLSATTTFVLTLSDVQPPQVTPNITSSTVPEDSVAFFNLALTDDKDVSQIHFSWTTDNPALVPHDNVLFSPLTVGTPNTTGSQGIVISPVQNGNGTANITITATDADQLDTSVTLKVIYTPVEDQPTIDLVIPSNDAAWTVLNSTNRITALEDANPIADDKTGSKLIEFTIADPETAADSLTVTASSGNSTLFPNDAAHVSVSTTGATRTLRLIPAANLSGDSTITVTVTDQAGKTDVEKFIATVTAVNDAPTINAISNISISEDSSQQTVNLAGIGAGGATDEGGQTLTVIASAVDKGTSSNTLLTSTPVVTYTSPNATGTVTFTPTANATGTSVITVTVDDSSGGTHTKSVSFEVAINPVNDAPTIRLLEPGSTSLDLDPVNKTTASGVAFGPVGIIITDAEATSNTALNDLSVTATSDNTTLIPNANLELGGSAGTRGLTVKPVAGLFGSANITVTVTDKGQPVGTDVKSASKSFKLTVTAGQNPTISSISNITLNPNQDSDAIPFTISDAQTAADSLSISTASSDTSVISLSNIQTAGSGTSRLLAIRAGSKPGFSDVTLTVKDADNFTATTTFRVTVLGQAPTISAIANQTVAKGGTTGPLSFTVNDVETISTLLTLTKASSNPTFVPLTGIVFGGSGANRTVTVTPAADKEGSSTITVIVTDTNGQTNSVSFAVSTPDNNPTAPTISAIADQATGVGVNTAIIPFTVGDAETTASLLTVTGHSSDQTIVPDSNVFLGGSGANRTVLLSPLTGKSGQVTITLTVTDTGSVPKSTSTSFKLTVADNNAPTISAIVNQTTTKNVPTSSIAFTVNDTETAAGSLTVTGSSANKTLVPDANVVISGSGSSRSVVVTPANGQTGTAVITLTVTDAGSKSASTSFTLTVNAGASVKGDLTGDGVADVVFQDADGFLAVWTLNGLNVTGASYLTPSNIGDLSYGIVGTGDFNGDGKEDVLFQNKNDGGVAVWYMDGVTQTDAAAVSLSPGDKNWKVVGTGDIDNDGKVDLVFQHTDGTLAVWFLNGVTVKSAALIDPSNPGDAAWRVVGVGDLTGDGRQDLVFEHNDGTLAYWSLGGTNGVTVTGAGLLDPSSTGDAAWRVSGVADRNGDGKADLLLQNNDGTLGIWFMNGTKVTSAGLLNPANPGVTWKALGPR